jgi:predicted O-methyltransferase YrrM
MQITELPIVGPASAFVYRLKGGFPYVHRPFRQFLGWLVTSTEHTNYTYDLDPVNKRYLAAFVAELTGTSFDDARQWIAELDTDTGLLEHLVRSARDSSRQGHRIDTDIQFGRRLGWYAVARATKPRVVVETGVDKGLGAAAICAALRRNADEGFPGEYIGTEIDPEKGFLLGGDYSAFGRIVYGDSIETLRSLDRTIDLFINDSDHSDDYERREYETIERKLGAKAIVIGDNWASEKLLEFALRSGRRFLFFREEPLAHWYPGEGIAAAFGSRAGTEGAIGGRTARG